MADRAYSVCLKELFVPQMGLGLSILLSLDENTRQLRTAEVKCRGVEVADVPCLLKIPLATHLEQPFPLGDPGLQLLFDRFLQSLQPSPVLTSPRQKGQRSAPEAVLTAKYFSKSLNKWLALSCREEDIFEQRKNYTEMAECILRMKGVLNERDISKMKVSFLLYLLYKKRRSDILCKFCSISPLKENTSAPTLPRATADGYNSVHDSSSRKRIERSESLLIGRPTHCKTFLILVTRIMNNIILDGNSHSAVDILLKIIIDERKGLDNERLVKKVAGVFCPENVIADKNQLKLPLLMKILPKTQYDFDTIFTDFSKCFVTKEEFRNFLLLDSINTFLYKTPDRRSVRNFFDSSVYFKLPKTEKTPEEPELELETDSCHATSSEMKMKTVLAYWTSKYMTEERTSILLPYRRSKYWYILFDFLEAKGRTGVKYYNDLWKLYRAKLHGLTPGSFRNVFPTIADDDLMDSATIYHLKRYVKYSMAVLQYCFPLIWNIECLHRLYSVRPRFLCWEVTYILRDVLAYPCHKPALLPDLVELSEKLKRVKRVANMGGENIQSPPWSVAKDGERRPGTPTASVAGSSDDSNYYNRLIDSLESIEKPLVHPPSEQPLSEAFDSTDDSLSSGKTVLDSAKKRATNRAKDTSEDLRTNAMVQENVEQRKRFMSLIAKRSAILEYLRVIKDKWRTSPVNHLKEFEDIVLLNINYWNTYDESNLNENYEICAQVYNETMHVLKKVGEQSDEKYANHVNIHHLKDYDLKKKREEVLGFIWKYRERTYTIAGFMTNQSSLFCRRPGDYYQRITECYTSIYNLVLTFTNLRDMTTTYIPGEWITALRRNFSFLPDVSYIIIITTMCSL